MYFTSGSDRAFEQLMQGKPGFDHYDSGEAVTPEDCGTCRFYRPHWKYQFCVYAECPYQPGKLTAYDAVTFRVFYSQHTLADFEKKCPILRVNALVRKKWLPSPFWLLPTVRNARELSERTNRTAIKHNNRKSP